MTSDHVRRVQELRRSSAASARPGKRYVPVIEARGGKDCYDAGGFCGPWDKNGICTKCKEKTG